ncbi:6-carboxytetrahydropterin synthase [Streptomyces albofaciens JCM 4342]|uniref:6-pyruvoyl trahydropterin synthase family protein n=1 Tax=Streptomyces albofaciens TaxID=66866 RepID=UPI000AC5F2AC|nr:6-carboxytetrahydropterin synthase [Streptomyces albofaciens]KAA6223856.1 6-carboxytetrahydropterin synthase [Streptomyces albofaciens JCM 4342]
MYVISKEFHFSASHRLASLPPGHQCARMHGHNYQVVLELRCDDTELTEAGFVRDFGELDEFKKWLDATFDHRHLNDAVPGMNPSAENLAWWVYHQWIGRLPELSCVRVSETPRTWAAYRGK